MSAPMDNEDKRKNYSEGERMNYFFTACFCYGECKDGTWRAFDSLDDYEAYLTSEENGKEN